MLRIVSILCLLALGTQASAVDLTGVLDSNSDAFEQDMNDRKAKEKELKKKRAAESAKKRTSTSFCYAIEQPDARYACLGEAFSTENLNSRNILNGHCSEINSRFVRLGLAHVCNEQTADSCGALSGKYRDLAYACRTCGGSRNWVATLAAGVVYQCNSSN